MTPLMTSSRSRSTSARACRVEGRIDAIFEREDGAWEVVDYKTGASDPDPLQLAIYARAVEEIWAKPTDASVASAEDRRRAGSAIRGEPRTSSE